MGISKGRPAKAYILGYMQILLIRHGLAGKANPESYPDDDLRPLTSKGRKSFKLAAKGLLGLGVRPEAILTSPALRARSTAEIFAKQLGISPKRVSDTPELHHAVPPAKALPLLARKRLPERIAMVGHEPWLGEFLSLIMAADPRLRFAFAKGGACLVEAPKLGKGKGRLLWLMTQDQLASLR